MEKTDFISLLDQIYGEVESMRHIVHEVDEEGGTSTSGFDILYGPKRDLQLCFLIFLAYTKSFDGDFPEDMIDMEILLNKYFPNNKTITSELWEYIKTETHDSFPQWMQLVKSSNLQNYRTPENDVLLLNWANKNYLFNDGAMCEFKLSVKLLLEVIDNTSDTLGLNLTSNRLLVIGDNNTYYKRVFTGRLNYSSYTLCPEDDYLNCCCLLQYSF